MKWRSKGMSMVISRTPSSNVAFKVARMSDSVLESQAAVTTREATEVGSSFD